MRLSTICFRACALTAAPLYLSLWTANAQTTQVDLKTQAKAIDFTKAISTKPFKTGTSLPATCVLGDSYFKTDATAGQNIYSCTALNTWTVQSGGGSAFPPLTGNANTVLGTDGTSAYWYTLAGDISGAPNRTQVTGLRGLPVSAATPTDGQVLRWNATANDWEPATVAATSSNSASATTGGDLYGPLSNTTVTRLQNNAVAALTPTNGQVLTWVQSAGQWQPLTPASGTSSASSGSSTSSVGLLAVTYVSANTLTIGAGCSVANPCNVRFGNNVIAITASSTITWQSGAGTAYIYVTSTGSIAVGSSVSLSCSAGCVVAAGVSSFPVNTIPVYTWSASLVGWDLTGGHDSRAYLTNKLLGAGTGVLLVESSQQSTIGIDTTLIPTYTNGAATLAFGTLAANSCGSDLTLAVPGAVVGDSVAPGWPAALPGSVLGNMRVSSANTVSVRLCNLASAAATVASATYRATVVRGL